MRPAESLKHGTYAGYQKHHKRGEEPCTPCREANTQYTRDLRAASGELRRKDRWWNTTRAAAVEQLVREYPERFAEILAEIRAERLADL